MTFTTTIVFGDVDLATFDGVGVSATRIAVSANNGTTTESVTFSNTTGSSKLFQVEVRAIQNSRFSISTMQGAALAISVNREQIPTKDDPTNEVLVGGPPALRTAIDEPMDLFLPLIIR